MGVAENFREFCSNLAVSNKNVISARYKAITKRLNTDFWDTNSESVHSLYVGSYGRNTAIDGFSDLDMIFRLRNSEYTKYNGYTGKGQSALLQAVKNSLIKKYPSTVIGADGQVIVVSFSDGIKFEIVPAFINKDDSYTYPDSNHGGSWKVTNPKPEIKAIKERNSECNNNLIPLCRMMRAWKKKRNVPLGGLLIDTLAYQFIEGWKYKDKSYLYYKDKSYLYYDYLSRDFFEFMAGQDEEQEYWKAPGSGQRVYKKGLFQYKAKVCYNLALEAINYESNDQSWSSKEKWREIYGTRFPA